MEDRVERLIAAEQDERRRIALFLHDGPVQQLSGIALMLDAAQHSIAEGRAEEAREIIAKALERHRDTIRELRDLSFALEPVILRDQGFGPALQALAAQIGETHALRVDVSTEGAERLGQTAQVALYTIIRELIDQSVRRGPPTKIAATVVRTPDGGVEVSVADDADPERRRRSFEAIEERVRQVHGEIRVRADHGGTDVRVTLPPYTAQR
ncbi:MAG TPA: histidine kinase [Gaiellaceae bacterium]|nr:histidine kinase [Gaiellaceae bacterium]